MRGVSGVGRPVLRPWSWSPRWLDPRAGVRGQEVGHRLERTEKDDADTDARGEEHGRPGRILLEDTGLLWR